MTLYWTLESSSETWTISPRKIIEFRVDRSLTRRIFFLNLRVCRWNSFVSPENVELERWISFSRSFLTSYCSEWAHFCSFVKKRFEKDLRKWLDIFFMQCCENIPVSQSRKYVAVFQSQDCSAIALCRSVDIFNIMSNLEAVSSSCTQQTDICHVIRMYCLNWLSRRWRTCLVLIDVENSPCLPFSQLMM